MKTIRHTITIQQFDSAKELSQEDSALLSAAHEALKNAYAPYSNYYVGAAVLLENGETVSGNNQENMAYPSGLCAERVAVFSAGAKFPGVKFKAIAIVASHNDHPSNRPSASCGACRQSMMEYEMKQRSPIRILMQGKTGTVNVVESVGDLLPMHFELSILNS